MDTTKFDVVIRVKSGMDTCCEPCVTESNVVVYAFLCCMSPLSISSCVSITVSYTQYDPGPGVSSDVER